MVEKQSRREKELIAMKKKLELEDQRNLKRNQLQQNISEIQEEYKKTVIKIQY